MDEKEKKQIEQLQEYISSIEVENQIKEETEFLDLLNSLDNIEDIMDLIGIRLCYFKEALSLKKIFTMKELKSEFYLPFNDPFDKKIECAIFDENDIKIKDNYIFNLSNILKTDDIYNSNFRVKNEFYIYYDSKVKKIYFEACWDEVMENSNYKLPELPFSLDIFLGLKKTETSSKCKFIIKEKEKFLKIISNIIYEINYRK